jgi:hypothetical protein
VLTWFGRDPSFEEKHREWNTLGKTGREPEKFHFVKGFHRGLELFGQHASRLDEPGYRDRVRELGLIVVEGPNDVISLDSLGVPAVGILSNHITDDQVGKIAQWSHCLSGGRVTLLLDCDEEGEMSDSRALRTHVLVIDPSVLHALHGPQVQAGWLQVAVRLHDDAAEDREDGADERTTLLRGVAEGRELRELGR